VTTDVPPAGGKNLAGASAEKTNDIGDSVTCQPDPMAAMVQTAPHVLRSRGITPNRFPLAAFGCGGTAWGAGIYTGHKKLEALENARAMAREKENYNARVAVASAASLAKTEGPRLA
jgi:hypothetical protein